LKPKLDFKKLFNKKGAGFVALGIVAGLILLLMPTGNAKNTPSEPKTHSTAEEYCTHLETKTEGIISRITGVKDCCVFITLEKGYRYVYATDQHVYDRSDGKDTDKTIVLAGNGNGEDPILVEETMPSVAGVAVVCPRADYQTQYKIVELLSALFNIPSNRISVQA